MSFRALGLLRWFHALSLLYPPMPNMLICYARLLRFIQFVFKYLPCS